MIRLPSERKTSSKAAVNFGVSVTDEELYGPIAFGQVGDQVPRHLDHPRAGGVTGDAQDVDPPTIELEGKEHVELTEEDRVDRKEVHRQDALGLDSEKLGPGGTPTPRRWTKAVGTKDPPDGGGAYSKPELSELALDPDTAPVAVLPAQADDELHGRRW